MPGPSTFARTSTTCAAAATPGCPPTPRNAPVSSRVPDPRSAVACVTRTGVRSHRRVSQHGHVEGRGASDGPTVTVFGGFQSQLNRQAKRLKPYLDVCMYVSRGHIAKESGPYSKDAGSFSALRTYPRPCRAEFPRLGMMGWPFDASNVSTVRVSVYPM